MGSPRERQQRYAIFLAVGSGGQVGPACVSPTPSRAKTEESEALCVSSCASLAWRHLDYYHPAPVEVHEAIAPWNLEHSSHIFSLWGYLNLNLYLICYDTRQRSSSKAPRSFGAPFSELNHAGIFDGSSATGAAGAESPASHAAP